MKLQQLRYLVEAERHGLNLSVTADTLHTSQPGISKQIKLLEDELGVEIFVRNGKRVTAVTPPGRAILAIAQRILHEADNLKQAAQDFADQDSGKLTIATTHTQARYALPGVVQRFTQRYPKVKLGLVQGNPMQICEYTLGGQADFCIATEAIGTFEELVMLPVYAWNRCVIAPPDHPILRQKTLTLEVIAQYPVITYDFAFTGRSQINQAFATRGLKPNVVLTAIDSDVIKTYVALGLGIGILAQMAFDPASDTNLRALDASHLFESSTTRIGIPHNAYLRGYVYDFIEMFAPHLSRRIVDSAVHSKEHIDYDL
jgi:LysR family transcriptional regulator, cys regulon transcriptional activator